MARIGMRSVLVAVLFGPSACGDSLEPGRYTLTMWERLNEARGGCVLCGRAGCATDEPSDSSWDISEGGGIWTFSLISPEPPGGEDIVLTGKEEGRYLEVRRDIEGGEAVMTVEPKGEEFEGNYEFIAGSCYNVQTVKGVRSGE